RRAAGVGQHVEQGRLGARRKLVDHRGHETHELNATSTAKKALPRRNLTIRAYLSPAWRQDCKPSSAARAPCPPPPSEPPTPMSRDVGPMPLESHPAYF